MTAGQAAYICCCRSWGAIMLGATMVCMGGMLMDGGMEVIELMLIMLVGIEVS